MLHNSPSNITACIDVTSKPRLSSYRQFFRVDDHDSYSIYKWNNELSSRFMHLIGIVEIALRNRIHAELASELNRLIPAGKNHSDDWYNYINKPQETQNKLNSELLHRNGTLLNPAPTANQIVSKMSFGFWPNMLKNGIRFLFEHTSSDIDWDRVFKRIFPGLQGKTLGYWQSFAHREPIIARCFSVNDLRNRVAHFEPLWKFGKDPSETIARPGVKRTYSAKPQTISDMMNRLCRDFERVKELLLWLSPETHKDYISSENNSEIKWLMTTGAIESFKSHQHCKQVSLIPVPEGPGCSAIMIEDKKIGIAFIYAE